MNYDFSSLSGWEFEILVRDLVQEERSLIIEDFPSGPDQGIDFRYVDSKKRACLIGQCKHYIKSGFSKLLNQLKRHEIYKAKANFEIYRDYRKFREFEYILATSISLSALQKSKIEQVFHELIPSQDFVLTILGKEDLNNRLKLYPSVTTNHFKLWLTSKAVLDKVLNSTIWNESSNTYEEIKRHVRKYVENPSRERAKSLLEQHGYCIISGIPGIGKTTLAEVIILEYIQELGYQFIKIGHNMSEIHGVADSSKRQLFYFDDFLGKTTLDKLQKNEDKDLVSFLRRVAENKNWRFILTTREYILQSAKVKYEELDHAPFEIAQCTINISDYTRAIRAKIIFNHVYFSNLPTEFVKEFLKYENFLKVLTHRNYNPRVIEYMTDSFMIKNIASEDYINEFLSNLNNPIKIWAHAFKNQISEIGRSILLVMSSLPDETLFTDIEKIITKFHKKRCSIRKYTLTQNDFLSAIKQLDGNFISTKNIGHRTLIEYHSPSIQDFISFYLSESEKATKDLYSCFIYFDQFIKLFRGQDGSPTKALIPNIDDFYKKAILNIKSESSRLIRFRGFISGEISDVLHVIPTWESRVLSFLEMSEIENTDFAIQKQEELLAEFFDNIDKGDVGDLISSTQIIAFLVEENLENEFNEEDKLLLKNKYDLKIKRLFHLLYKKMSSVEAFEAFTILYAIKPNLVLKNEFQEVQIKYQKEKRKFIDPLKVNKEELPFLMGKLKRIEIDLGFPQVSWKTSSSDKSEIMVGTEKTNMVKNNDSKKNEEREVLNTFLILQKYIRKRLKE